MSSEPIYYECVCGYETFVAAYTYCPGCGRHRRHTKQLEGNPKRRGFEPPKEVDEASFSRSSQEILRAAQLEAAQFEASKAKGD